MAVLFTVLMISGPWFNIKMSSYQYRKSHCGDQTVVRSRVTRLFGAGMTSVLHLATPYSQEFDRTRTIYKSNKSANDGISVQQAIHVSHAFQCKPQYVYKCLCASVHIARICYEISASEVYLSTWNDLSKCFICYYVTNDPYPGFSWRY